MKKLRRIEPTKVKTKNLKVAAYCRVSTTFEANKAALTYKFLIMKTSYKATLSGNTQVFILIMVVGFVKKVIATWRT